MEPDPPPVEIALVVIEIRRVFGGLPDGFRQQSVTTPISAETDAISAGGVFKRRKYYQETVYEII